MPLDKYPQVSHRQDTGQLNLVQVLSTYSSNNSKQYYMRQFNFKRGEQAKWDKEPRFASVWLTKIPHTSPLVFHPASARFITLAESSDALFWEAGKWNVQKWRRLSLIW